MEDLDIPVGPLTFRARAAGPPDGELVLLLHGFPQTSWCWRAQLEALGAAGYRAVAPDQRGYSPGARPGAVEAYRCEHLVADVIALADELGGHAVHLAGHDWGGAVAWQVAGRHPHRLRTLTVVSTPHPRAFADALAGGTDQAQRSSYMQLLRAGNAEERLLADDGDGLRTLLRASGLSDDESAPYVEALAEPAALTGALNWYRAMDRSLLEGLQPVTVPTLYVWSSADPALGPDAAHATARHVVGPYRFEVLEGVSHWVPEHAPERLNRLLLEHLRASHG